MYMLRTSLTYQARSKQSSFGQAILYHLLVCVHAHDLGIDIRVL